jgi:hypothetical protein
MLAPLLPEIETVENVFVGSLGRPMIDSGEVLQGDFTPALGVGKAHVFYLMTWGTEGD